MRSSWWAALMTAAKCSTVAKMPHTTGTGGMPLWSLTSRCTVVGRLRSSLTRLVPLRILL